MDPLDIIGDPFPAPPRSAFGDQPSTAYGTYAPIRYIQDDGSKFAGGFGVTKLLSADYWTLRARSVQLFETNLYARGLIRRLITNEINTGLNLESTPEELILGYEEDDLAEWTEEVENRFSLWGENEFLCDQAERSSFGALQMAARMEALIAGDVLVVLRQDPRTGLPRVQLISGSAVRNPSWDVKTANKCKHGVELDSQGRHVAFWVTQDDGTSKRLPAFGEKSGRRLAWLVYGTDKRLDDVRGKPMLSLILQSLQEVDRYRDATQRKAQVLSMLAMYIAKSEDKPGTLPISAGAVRKGAEIQQTAGGDRVVRTSEHIPGLVIEELNKGEEPKAFKVDGAIEGFGVFEEAIIQAVAWANEIPPEILTLSFSSNYGASQAAINEFKMYLNKVRALFGETFLRPIYIEWLIAEVNARRIKAPGLLEAKGDLAKFDVFGAWVRCDWSGQIKPAVDLTKLVGAYTDAVYEGFITRDRASRELFGMKHSKVVQRTARENIAVAAANMPLAELEAASKTPPQPEGPKPLKKAPAKAAQDEESVFNSAGYPRRRRHELLTR